MARKKRRNRSEFASLIINRLQKKDFYIYCSNNKRVILVFCGCSFFPPYLLIILKVTCCYREWWTYNCEIICSTKRAVSISQKYRHVNIAIIVGLILGGLLYNLIGGFTFLISAGIIFVVFIIFKLLKTVIFDY